MIELSPEQKNIANFSKSGPLIVKGTAGSGKTIVGLQRVPYLIDKLCQSDTDKILIITYTKTLTSYLEYLLTQFDLDVSQQDLSFIEKSKIKPKIINIDKLIYNFGPVGFGILDNKTKKEILKGCIVQLKNKTKEPLALLDVQNVDFIEEEINWIRDCNITSLSEYMVCERKGRGRGNRVTKNSDIRQCLYDILDLYRAHLHHHNKLDLEERRLCTLHGFKTSQSLPKYVHVIVDEAQDLTKVQLLIINQLCESSLPQSTLMYLYDSAQSIYPGSWLGNSRTFKSVGLDIPNFRSKKLTKSFRTTKEIHTAAHQMLLHDPIIKENEGYVEPDFENDSGIKPFYKDCRNNNNQLNYISDLVKNLLSQYRPNEIFIAARYRQSLNGIAKVLTDNSIKNNFIQVNGYQFGGDSIGLTTLHSVKGLEAKVVILMDINERIIPKSHPEEQEAESLERKLLYVAMTRASEILHLTSFGRQSRFIDQIRKQDLTVIHGGVDVFQEKLMNALSEYKKAGSNISSKKFEELLKKLELAECKLSASEKDKEELEEYVKIGQKQLVNIDRELKSSVKKLKESGTKLIESEVKLTESKLQKKEMEQTIKASSEMLNETEREKRELEKSIKNRATYEESLDDVTSYYFNNLSKVSMNTLAHAMCDYHNAKIDNREDYSPIYSSFSKVLEIELKNYCKKRYERETHREVLTLGFLIHLMNDMNPEFRDWFKPLERMRLLLTRNSGTHEAIIRYRACKELYDFLITEQGLDGLLNITHS